MNEGLVEAIKSITGDGSHGDPENRKMEGKTQILGMKHPCPKQPRAPTRFLKRDFSRYSGPGDVNPAETNQGG